MYSYLIIRTEKSLINYSLRLWNEVPVFSGDFARIHGTTIEKMWAKLPADDHYVPYYLLISHDPKGRFGSVLNIRDKVHDCIIKGKLNFLTV